jgi:hypothetical protein
MMTLRKNVILKSPHRGRLEGRTAPISGDRQGISMASEAKLLTVQFLQWLAARPRSHAEVRNAWSSTCPLNCAFEDAISDDLVERSRDGHLVLSERGRARLAEAAIPGVA